MEKRINKKYFVITSVLFIFFVLLNIFISHSTLERGDNYYNILGSVGLIENHLEPIGDYDLFQHRSDVTLNHPPFIFYFWALILFVFKTPIALNTLGMVFILLSGFLIIKVLKLINKDISDKTLIISYVLFLFVPLIMQGSYLIDLDNILPFTMLLFTYFYLKNSNRIFINSLFFMLIWITKIQGVPIIASALFLYLIFTKKPKKDFFNGLLIISVGSALFFILVYLYANFFNVDFARMFTHSSIIGTILKQLSNPSKAILTSVWSMKQLIFWILPSMFVLYLIGIFNYVKRKEWKTNEKLMLPILVSVMTLFELVPIGTYGWNFPKYYLEFIPFMILTISPIIEKIKFSKKDFLKIAILLLISINYFLLVADPYIPEVNEAFTQKNYFDLAMKVIINFDILIIPLILSFIFYKGWKSDKNKLIKILIIASFVSFLSIGIMQITKPYSTNNLYGDSHEDLTNTLNYLRENANSEDKLFLFPHVGYYFGNSDNTNWYNSMLCYNSEDCIKNVTQNQEVKFMQFYPKDLKRLDGKVKEIVEEEFKYDVQFGDYVIYKRIENLSKSF
ncbi:MAG: hypothetical protein PVJ67_03490 [Candidatus Pacearchaeota archaeon]|jgi:hypothetical protein